ncbi:hypothetical protein [Methanobrevibacter sp.]|uniref:hypothetical protein n=1 Tax=Methanobrevibacter sp. TaxID=66852 RepID=UPI00386D0601
MAESNTILKIIALIIVVFLASTIVSPILIVAEDTAEDSSIDMAASIGLTGFKWIYPGNSVNAEGQTLHNVHINDPQDPYGAARDIMSYTYHVTPHLIVSVNNDAACAIFGESIVDDIRANDGYHGYAGNGGVQGSMDRGDAVSTAMIQDGINIIQIPIQVLLGNISFHIV